MRIDDLEEIKEESERRDIPVLGRKKGEYLLKTVFEEKPDKVLEIGTAIGYSGIILGSAGAELTTIDKNKREAKEAVSNFAEFNIKAKVVTGRGEEVVKFLDDDYNLVFLDFEKNLYEDVLEDCIRLCKEGGLIIADNAKMEKCSDYLEKVQNHPRLETRVVDIGDGLAESRVL